MTGELYLPLLDVTFPNAITWTDPERTEVADSSDESAIRSDCATANREVDDDDDR